METLTMHYEITPEAIGDNNELTQVFLNNTEASFGKMILDFIKLGNIISILKYFSNRGNVEVQKEVIGIDPDTGEQTTLIEKTLVDSYSYTVIVELLRTNVGTKQEKCERNSHSKNISVIDGKIEISKKETNKIPEIISTVNIKESPGQIPNKDKELYDELELEKAETEAKKAIEDQKKENKKNKEPKEPNEDIIIKDNKK